MERELPQRLTAGYLAGTVGLSVSQLARLFRAETGVTPGGFLHHLRMTRARILVERTSLPVSEIMRQVGISDRSHFAREFRHVFGVSARSLRIQQRRSGRGGVSG